MPYRDEFMRKLQQLREYKTFWETNQQEALKIKNIIPAKEASTQLGRFMMLLSNSDELYGGKEARQQFLREHADILPNGRFPHISTSPEHCQVTIAEADYEKIFDLLDEKFKDNPQVLEDLFNVKAAPDYRGYRHPMENLINDIKSDVDRLYEEENIKAELKAALDFSNEELIEKTGTNFFDNVIDANSNMRSMQARREFDSFVLKNGLDPDKVKNKTTLLTVISPGVDNHPENYETFKPFLDMGITYDADYKSKLLQLDALCQQEGLLTNPMGGETGFKEYSLADYFQKNYALKKALTDYSKLTDDADRKVALADIKTLTEEVKEVTGKYEKVFDFIEKNFDLENVSLSGNVYSGRPGSVPDGDLEKWRPNLPPKFDFEKSPAVIFLSGFTQLKSACIAEKATLQEYLDDPVNVYLRGAKEYSDADDRKIYLPRSEENTLGKRMAHAFYYSTSSYSEIRSVSMMGGRGMEFLYNTSPNDDKTTGNVIKSQIIKEFTKAYNHDPGLFFGNSLTPNADVIKNIFVAGDEVDNLRQLSPNYINDDYKVDPYLKDYSQAVKGRGNVPVDVEYRRIMNTMRECFQEQEEMSNHPETYLKRQGDSMEHFAQGAIIAAGRQYFADYLRQNNLSLDSVQDEALRAEMRDFMADPVQTFNDHHFQFTEDTIDDLDKVKRDCKNALAPCVKKNAGTFMEKFEQNNHKPNGYNVGKDIETILQDNRGGWWERFRGTTSKQYQALVKAADPYGPVKGDKEAMYHCAKAYRAYKLPEGRRFESLSKTAKKRIEFCDSIINAYEQEKAAEVAANNPAPVSEAENNNIIIDQNDFQSQLQNDVGPKETKDEKVEDINEEVEEKDPLEESATI